MTKTKIMFAGLVLVSLLWLPIIVQTGVSDLSGILYNWLYDYEYVEVKVQREAEKPVSLNLEQVADKIRVLESSGGRNDGCLKKGKINGYGYAQSTFTWNCFDSHQEVRSKVIGWLDKRINQEKLSLATALCYYNTGHKKSDCNYYKNYQSI